MVSIGNPAQVTFKQAGEGDVGIMPLFVDTSAYNTDINANMLSLWPMVLISVAVTYL